MRNKLLVGVLAATALCLSGTPALADAGGGPVATPTVTGCAVDRWGSLPRSAPGMSSGSIVGVRIGQGPCADRIVFDVKGATPGWNVRYVSQITADGSGAVVPVAGGAKLLIVIRVNAHDVVTGRPTIADLPQPTRFAVFRQLVLAGDFEGVTTVGLGVRARLPFRTFSLPGPKPGHSRVVIDVAQSWR